MLSLADVLCTWCRVQLAAPEERPPAAATAESGPEAAADAAAPAAPLLPEPTAANDSGRRRLRDYFTAVREGCPPDQCWEAAFGGVDEERLARDWRRYTLELH